MLLEECQNANVKIQLDITIDSVEAGDNSFILQSSRGVWQGESLVVATGGLSIPKMGATPLGYRIAEQFGHILQPTAPGLVPFTLQPQEKARFSPLSGIALEAIVHNEHAQFRENLLFTHRGLSGPVILQISSYWQPGESITINLLPDLELDEYLEKQRQAHPNSQIKTSLGKLLPKRLVAQLIQPTIGEQPLKSLTAETHRQVQQQLQQWTIQPNGTEGYRTAEVTVGGVDCDQLSSKTMESKLQPGLYFVGEVMDVTGWLGGYNLQWAWSSGWCAGQVV